MNRRDVLKLCAAGLAAPAVSQIRHRETMGMQAAPASWPLDGGNPARTNVMTGAGPSFDAPVAKKWGWTTVSAGGWSVPIVDNGTLYHSPLPGSGLYALDFESGAELWHALPEMDISYQIASDGIIFAAEYYGQLYALDAATGQELWHTRVDGIVARSMIALGDNLYARTNYGGILALDTSDGSERWYLEERADDTSSIAIERGILYFCSDSGVLFAIDIETGLERWRTTIPAGEPQSDSTILVADDTIYLRDYQGGLRALDSEAGAERWSTTDGAAYQLSAVDKGRVFGNSPHFGAYALDASSGEMLWNFSTSLDMNVSGVAGNTVLAQGMGSWREMWRIHGLDAITGNEIWSYECPPRTYSPTVIGNNLMTYGLIGYVVGNLSLDTLSRDVVVRGAPSPSGVQTGSASSGDSVTTIWSRQTSGGTEWAEVTIDGISGWIPADAIVTTSPPGDVEYVYVPD